MLSFLKCVSLLCCTHLIYFRIIWGVSTWNHFVFPRGKVLSPLVKLKNFLFFLEIKSWCKFWQESHPIGHPKIYLFILGTIYISETLFFVAPAHPTTELWPIANSDASFWSSVELSVWSRERDLFLSVYLPRSKPKSTDRYVTAILFCWFCWTWVGRVWIFSPLN